LRSFALPLSLMLLFCSGCLELVRRPQTKAGGTYSAQTASDSSKVHSTPGNLANAVDVQIHTPAIASVHPKRSNQQRSAIKQVNEYALWCINNSMWNEARLHMERAIAADSLAASLHNNLGIVYERLGQTDKATNYYQQALALNPDKEAYQANLKKMQTRKQAFQDTSNDFDIFRVTPTERRQRGASDRDDEMPTLIGE
jgi:Flp pilus assembly protein TadD